MSDKVNYFVYKVERWTIELTEKWHDNKLNIGLKFVVKMIQDPDAMIARVFSIFWRGEKQSNIEFCIRSQDSLDIYGFTIRQSRGVDGLRVLIGQVKRK